MNCSKHTIALLVAMWLSVSITAAANSVPPGRAKWTVMVYMNANNNLESAAIVNFAEMANVQYTNDVRVVVQLKRKGQGLADSTPRWSGVRRYLIQEGAVPDDASKISDLHDVNMGDGRTLSEFVAWATSTYPAERYALIMWCHGSGWRNMEIKSDGPSAPTPVATPPAAQTAARKVRAPSGVMDSSFKASSEDEGVQLYNAELAIAIRYAMAGQKLDLLAFDSCLMGMAETAYAVRNVADVLVASEDLVPQYGFDYTALLNALTQKIASPADVTALDFARMMIDTYKSKYSSTSVSDNDFTQTLSAVDLTNIPALSAAITSFSQALVADLPKEKKVIQKARAACANFAPPDPNCQECQSAVFFHVDIRRFATQVAGTAADPRVKNAAMAVVAALDGAIGGRNYAGSERAGGRYGAAGLAIYFPPDGLSYKLDIFNDRSYDKPATNTLLLYPPEFVADQQWADFLHAYYEAVPQ
jgi:hypothetical protein